MVDFLKIINLILLREFCDKNTNFEEMKLPYIPLWSDILDNRG